jgi:spore coat protein A
MRKNKLIAMIHATTVGVLLMAVAMSSQLLQAQALLDAQTHPKFVNPLPIPGVMKPKSAGKDGKHYEIAVTQFQQWLGLVDANGNRLMTTVWGYNGTYPGATIEARTNRVNTVRWNNELTDKFGNPLPNLLPVDVSVHWADPLQQGYPAAFNGPVPIVTHLHGGHSESASDGLPEAWFTPGFKITGPDFVKKTYRYDNDQQAATLWYHDHALGITRLNVYAGLAGFYLLRDENEEALMAARKLPSGAYEIPIAIQDRMFTADGKLFYPSAPEVAGAPNPSVLPEFFGDFILANGMAWPKLKVEPRKYRLRLLNGSDSRFYRLAFSSGQTFHQIGTDIGFLNAPVALTSLVIGPGERADLIVDFAGYNGQTIILTNDAPIPFPDGDPVNPGDPVSQITAFEVSLPLSSVPDAQMPTTLNAIQKYNPLAAARARKLLLFEGMDQFGRLQPMLGTVQEGKKFWHDPITENPMVNDVEIWEVYNTTPDAHPIHLHLVAFQLINREDFTATQDPNTGALTNIVLSGTPTGPAANEDGWKDTAQMFPGQVTRIIAKFDRKGEYVWHCHILSHEDHEMMRPYYVGRMQKLMHKAVLAENEAAPPASIALEQNYPNPFWSEATSRSAENPSTTITFSIPEVKAVTLQIYDLRGALVKTLVSGTLAAGRHQIVWNGTNAGGQQVASGVYLCRIQSESFSQVKQVLLMR